MPKDMLLQRRGASGTGQTKPCTRGWMGSQRIRSRIESLKEKQENKMKMLEGRSLHRKQVWKFVIRFLGKSTDNVARIVEKAGDHIQYLRSRKHLISDRLFIKSF